jgi:hypothetical protein
MTYSNVSLEFFLLLVDNRQIKVHGFKGSLHLDHATVSSATCHV